MSAKIRALQAKKVEQIKAARDFNDAIDAKASAEGRSWSAEEQTQYDGLRAAIDTTTAQINREQQLAVEEAGMAAVVAANVPRGPPASPAAATPLVLPTGTVIGPVGEATDEDPQRGFRNFGEYARSVRDAGMAARIGQAMDSRLVPLAAAPSTFAGEGAGADGGILVPPGFSNSIFTLSLMDDALLPLTDDIPIEGNNMLLPKDETTPWGTTGVRAYWQGEGSAGTPTKPLFGGMDLRLKKLLALVPVTNELLADSTALNAYLPARVAMSMRWKTNEAILFGSGAGIPLGALTGAASVVQAKDSGQATLTLTTLNLLNMFSRLPPGSFGRAVWMINNNVIPALGTLTLGNYPIFLPVSNPNGAIQGGPQWTLLGRPVMISQHAKSFTSQGDVLLLDLSYYQAITKADGMQTATSMHLYFDADIMAFRTTFRMDGQPKIAAAISPANGSTTLSPFVQLAAR